MRKIKFRGWDKRTNQMIGVKELQFDRYNELKSIGLGDLDSFIPLNLVRVELMQFTGLLDKNGKEIYEGDLIKILDGSIHEVLWSGGSFIFENKISAAPLWFMDSTKWEVIGNIYENPDLLLTPKQ